MSQPIEKRGYLLEKFRLFHLKDRGGVQVDYHYHDFCKLLMLCSGSGGYSVEGQLYHLQPGDIVLIGDRCVHRPEFAPETPYERVIIYIDPEFIRGHSSPDCDLQSIFSGENGHVLRCDAFGQQRLFGIAEELEQELAAEQFGSVIVSQGQLLRLLVEIGRNFRSGGSSMPKPIVPRDERIRLLIQYIDRHLTEELTVEELGAQVYLSKFHLMRLFKAETGQSVHDYISQRRLLMARELIRQGENVTDVCFRVGYRSYSAFFRGYSKLFGVTPTGKPDGAARESSFE